MDIFQIDHLSFSYPGTHFKALKDISLRIAKGDFTVICGPSGCGKTTLLQLLKREITPAGTVNGVIQYNGKPLHSWNEIQLAEEIGFVFQDPDNQIVMDQVLQELVFGMENLGYTTIEMNKRIAELTHFFGMEELLQKKISALSGGQKQLLNLLSVLLLKPKVLLLDEPVSQLDPVAAKDLINMLVRLNEEMGITIIMAEHRLDDLFSVADYLLVMDQGNIHYEGSCRKVISDIYQDNNEAYIPYISAVSQLYMKKSKNPVIPEIPLTVKECRNWLMSLHLNQEQTETANTSRHCDSHYLMMKDVFFQYTKSTPYILRNLSLQIDKGSFYVIAGGNGSGKSTLLKNFTGQLRPQRGQIRFQQNKQPHKLKGKSLYESFAYLPQNPKSYFIHDTIEKEMDDVLERHKTENGQEMKRKISDVFGINHLYNKHPYDCSGGEIQKAALACMLLGNPDVLFIDEPTKGLDPLSRQQLGKMLQELNHQGLTIVMVTHDIEFAAKYATCCSMLFDGKIVAEGTPKSLFQGNYFYTTAINRATTGSDFEVLTLEEALALWSKHVSI